MYRTDFLCKTKAPDGIDVEGSKGFSPGARRLAARQQWRGVNAVPKMDDCSGETNGNPGCVPWNYVPFRTTYLVWPVWYYSLQKVPPVASNGGGRSRLDFLLLTADGWLGRLPQCVPVRGQTCRVNYRKGEIKKGSCVGSYGEIKG